MVTNIIIFFCLGQAGNSFLLGNLNHIRNNMVFGKCQPKVFLQVFSGDNTGSVFFFYSVLQHSDEDIIERIREGCICY